MHAKPQFNQELPALNASDLADELKALRKGRGVRTVPLAVRVGPMLRAVCGISPETDTAAARRLLSARLIQLIMKLPEDLRIVLLAAFALHETANMPFYQERVHWAARALDRDDRTIRRRIDEGIGQIAELAASSMASNAPESRYRGWHTKDLYVALALDRPVPEAIELRRIVADEDGVAELDLAVTLTREAAASMGSVSRMGDLDVDVFHGGTLVLRTMESQDRFRLTLLLPTPLALGTEHEVGMRFRARMRQQHYVCVPRKPVESFQLHVRFSHPPPAEVVQLDQVFQDDARDPTAPGTPVVPDNAGEIHLSFNHLAPGFAYGARWRTGPGNFAGGSQVH